ncbi:hypothetical protein FOZ62_024407 [Perkinsus olseni]|uniref:Cytochrome b5 heme-binding domain-containing protein n=2 Tax=Perkinsus olseni TaxID=32597 RepID=A0A7J6T8V3_PEROL|nr:hypothetical protein FOZ62_024407 [Perkinsus olseni]
MVDYSTPVLADAEPAPSRPSSGGTVIIKLFGKWVDVTYWLKDHPGGSKVLRAFNNKDATDAVMAMHSEEAIKRVLSMSGFNNNNDRSSEDELERRLSKEQLMYHRLQSDAKARGWYKANFAYEILKAVISFGMLLIGLGLLMLWPAHDGHKGLWSSVLLIGFGWYQLGWLGHDWSHHTALHVSNTKWAKIDDYLGWFTGVARGNTLLWWKLRHNTHHVLTNQYEHDPDILTQPLFHFFEDYRIGAITRYQALYYIPALTLLHIYWLYESIEVCIRQSRSINKHTRHHARRDSLAMILHVLGMGYIVYSTGHWLPIILSYMLSGFLTAIVVFASHYNEPRIPAHESLSLIRQTLLTTINIGSFTGTYWESKLWFYLTGGLNMQIEHHLFPTMPRHNLPNTTPLVKEMAKELGLPYKETNIIQCTVGAVSTLEFNALRNMKNRVEGVMKQR